MNDCVLRTPHRNFRSNEVFYGAVPYANAAKQSDVKHSRRGLTLDMACNYPSIPAMPTRKETSPISTRISVGQVRSRLADPSLRTPCMARPVTPFSRSEKQGSEMTQVLHLDKVRLRELRRTRQIRYRKKKERYIVDLEEQTRIISQSIDELEQRRRSTFTSIVPQTNVWSIAIEYFRLFRYGIRLATLFAASETDQRAQMDFVRTSMTEDVMSNSLIGADRLLCSWRQITAWFAPVTLELDRLEKRAAISLVATTTFTVSISELTLRHVFPHLYNGHGEKSAVALRLLGQSITMRGSTHFVWDDTVGRLVSITSQSDMVTPLLQCLGNLDDVSRVFEKALVTPEFQLALEE